MQLKYNRQSSLGSSIIKTLFKLLLLIIIFIFAIFLIEKISFPSPEKKYQIDVTDEIKKLSINSARSFSINQLIFKSTNSFSVIP